MQNHPKVYHLKMLFEENNSVFSKQGLLQKRKFSRSFQSISYNDVVFTKQIYFSLTFFKVVNSYL